MCHEKRLPEKWESSFNFVEASALASQKLVFLRNPRFQVALVCVPKGCLNKQNYLALLYNLLP
ncbi:hypothetical protein EIKCOROL_01445 [Eikenella corrodens ATCC 23834]|uniref:Uncharacterized protein n=1 Tax=Eikenella corrodens ATCC 23834 TaxID=546274 RepID=C0DVQ6_EIKCO|nr:hypothetical protein EIKCOROL_01445 [Eikenella corrodens ATCC 23834]